nr:uncharacterized protein LOC109155321 [Ipomoea batatas]
MGESKYAYLQTNDGLYRVNIPDFDPAHQPEFMLECVSKNLSGIITPTMGIFSKGQDVYLFGGLMFGVKGTIQYNRSLYFFNPRKVKEKEYPIRDSKLLYKSSLKYVPMVTPSVLQAKHKTYLFSVVRPDYGPMKALCYFQSFDPLKNCFCTLPTPSLDDSFLCYAPASQRCIPWDKVKPINDKSNEKEPKRKPGVVYLEVVTKDECQSAYSSAIEAYTSTIDNFMPYEKAVKSSKDAFKNVDEIFKFKFENTDEISKHAF